jgi:hypothetical protein
MAKLCRIAAAVREGIARLEPVNAGLAATVSDIQAMEKEKLVATIGLQVQLHLLLVIVLGCGSGIDILFFLCVLAQAQCVRRWP